MYNFMNQILGFPFFPFKILPLMCCQYSGPLVMAAQIDHETTSILSTKPIRESNTHSLYFCICGTIQDKNTQLFFYKIGGLTNFSLTPHDSYCKNRIRELYSLCELKVGLLESRIALKCREHTGHKFKNED